MAVKGPLWKKWALSRQELDDVFKDSDHILQLSNGGQGGNKTNKKQVRSSFRII